MISFLKNLIRWGRISGPASNQDNFSVQQITYLNKTADSLIVFPYGHHANVSNDSLALMFSVAAQPENRAAIAWTPNTRPDLEQNEIAIYHPFTNSLIHFKNSGDIDITGNAAMNVNTTGDVNITAPTVAITGDVTINGNLDVTGDGDFDGAVTASEVTAGTTVLTTHTHIGSPTAPTGAITNTGAPV